MSKEIKNEMVVIENNPKPVLKNREKVIKNLMAQAGIMGNLSNRQAINMVAQAIVADVALKPVKDLTIADAFALKAARAAMAAPTAAEEIKKMLEENGII